MSESSICIKLDNNKIALTNKVSLTYDKTNLPKHAFSFITHKALFWKLEQVEYNFTTKALYVKVIDYGLSSNTVLTDKEPKYPIDKLVFDKLDWEKFEPLIYSYTLSKLKNHIFNYKEKIITSKKIKHTPLLEFTTINEPTVVNKTLTLKIKYEDATFENSKIVFNTNIKPYKIETKLEIVNPFLRSEFEYIKPFLIRRMGKTFRATINFNLLDNKIDEITVLSDDINAINEQLIESIKSDSVLSLKHFKALKEDKNLHTIKELLGVEMIPNIVDASAKEILEIFIKNGDVLNVRQLEFLAINKQTLSEKLRFTTKPLFGFVFQDTSKNECFIWELLNSHATYIWKKNNFDERIDLSSVVDQAIGTIRNEGRVAYRNYYKSLINPGYDFAVLNHLSLNQTEEDRFNEWRRKLDAICL